MIAPYDHNALWMKAKVFINRAMDPEQHRSFDEQALWASAALELLGKSALAKVSPLLIAEPTDEGVNVLIAVGLIEGSAKFTSVRAATVFRRCGRAFKPFNAAAAIAIADMRNEYLHGAAIGFAPLDPDRWWPQFWALAATLLEAQDRTVQDLVGDSRSRTVELHLERNALNVEQRVESLLNRARQRLTQARTGTLPAKLQIEWAKPSNKSAGLRYSAEAACPACAGPGLLEGEDDSDVSYEYEPGWDEEDPGQAWATITVPAEYFSCPTCHLVFESYELLAQAGLPVDFTVIDDDPQPEAEYGND